MFLFWPLGWGEKMLHRINSRFVFVCVCLFNSYLISPSLPGGQTLVRQRGGKGGTPHLWERRGAEGRHTWSDPGRQTQGSPGGRAGDRTQDTKTSTRFSSTLVSVFSFWHCRFSFLFCFQFMGAEFGDDKASASDSSSRLSGVDRAERNSRALSLHNSITKSNFFFSIIQM